MRIKFLLALLLLPTALCAQTGGPGQPEFMQFTPATASELVNPSNGSFSYNIPLFDVGGYPVNLSYQSGVGMEDLASVVGLGWNINVGAVAHTMRGLPDDFRGDPVTRTVYMKPNITYGGNVGVGGELAGRVIGLNTSRGIFYNNYNGYGVERSSGLSISLHTKEETAGFGLSLGMHANSQSGVELYAQPNVWLRLSESGDLATKGSLGGTISVNSREGLKGSINTSMSLDQNLKYATDKSVSETLSSASATYSFAKTTEIPRVSYPFQTTSYTGSFKAGTETFFLHPNGTLRGYYTSQELATNTIITPAYGFLYSDQVSSASENILHDFNREKDQPYIKGASVNIGIPYYTYDIYSVNAQGISGSFQLNRSDIGVIFDNRIVSGGTALNIGAEVGFGNVFHAGADISNTTSGSSSGKWSSAMTSHLAFRGNIVDEEYQVAYFKNASDVSVDENNFFEKLGGDQAVKVKLNSVEQTASELTGSWEGPIQVSGNNFFIKEARDPRTINIQYLTADQADSYGLDRIIRSYPVNAFTCELSPDTVLRVSAGVSAVHHISEMTATNTDGMRYVFGLPVYNRRQKEVAFTLGQGQTPGPDGFVVYNPNTEWGTNGKDGFYESTNLPPYVTSHLLTAVLSPEYIDVDQNGPSLNDVGNYVKVNYSYAGIRNWRTPYDDDRATFNKALLSDPTDNKGSYVYGEKEQWYIHSIESKTQVAEFYYDVNGRKDGLGVQGESGGKDPGQKLYKLDSIKVYSINERVLKGSAAVPIRIVYFTYDYELCPGIHNTSAIGSTDNGKLTLKKVAFASGRSRRGIHSPYIFAYGQMPSGETVNPPYNPRHVNRWGHYQPNDGTSDIDNGDSLSNIDFPYSFQDEDLMTEASYAWNLTTITLPGAGTINVEYEPHRYAYTQDRRAMGLFPITAVAETVADLANGDALTGDYLKIELEEPITGPNADDEFRRRYFNNDFNQWYYYKAQVMLKPGYPEWISGYCKVLSAELLDAGHGAVQLQDVRRDEKGGSVRVNPIRKQAWQFMRMNRPELCYGPIIPYSGGLEGFLKLKDLNEKVDHQILAFQIGFNHYAQDSGLAATLVPGKSFLRLYSPGKNKIMGGCRVRRIVTDDNWSTLTGGASQEKTYSLHYEYTDVETNPATGELDAVSTGVVEYEPFNGQDVNPMRSPVFIDQHIKMAPDNRLYVETPFNESLFPAPNLTYAKVRITSNKTDLNVPGAGYQEMEYYTAREFPVITDKTILKNDFEEKTKFIDQFWQSLRGEVELYDYMALTQGFAITLNDMHGKQKAVRNYNSRGSLVAGERYHYVLGSDLDLINHNGSIYTSDKLGISLSAICDSRSFTHTTTVQGIDANLDISMISLFPGFLFVVLPSMSTETSRLNTVAMNKVIYKKGILTQKTVTENGAMISTENILFDDKTGFVVLSKTTNEFNDTIYNFHYPADWIYPGLSAGYISSDLQFTASPAGLADMFTVTQGVYALLAVGDEIVVPNSGVRCWLMSKTPPNLIELRPELLSGSVPISSGDVCLVLRPGRRNQLMQKAGTVVTHVNPISISSVTGKPVLFPATVDDPGVINASMQEFRDVRVPYCDCETSDRVDCSTTDSQGQP